MNTPELIVMLTKDDYTVNNAYNIFEECKHSKAKYWGFKESPLPLEEMKRLFSYMKSCSKITVLEVIAYTEEEGLKGAQIAIECGCDILLGTVYHDSIYMLCKQNNIKYMPFIGKIEKRPSILYGTIDEIIAEADSCIKKGVFGFDLLAYRYDGDSEELITRFLSNINAPVCIAGSINTYNRLDTIKECSPWAFTIGEAFFNNQFDGNFEEQINKVYDYIQS